MKKKLIFTLIVAIVGSLFALTRKHSLEAAAQVKVQQPMPEKAMVSVVKENAVVTAAAAPVISAVTKNEKVVSADKEEKTLKEPGNDETPQVVLDWSADLGFNMLEAFKNPAKAEKMFTWLRKCSENTSSAMAYRAVCAANAKRLSDRFPERFGQNYQGLTRGLPDQIQAFLAQAQTQF